MYTSTHRPIKSKQRRTKMFIRTKDLMIDYYNYGYNDFDEQDSIFNRALMEEPEERRSISTEDFDYCIGE